jgi:soluble lytic murein transglycosylase-like protein
MTSAPILRSAALQRANALAPAPKSTPPGTFATTLANARSAPNQAPAARPPAPTRTTAAAQWAAASQRMAAPPARALPAGGAGAIAPLDGTGAIPFAGLIESAARKYGFDPALLAGLIKAESNFNPNAKSGVGAKGLAQLMDATARGLGVTDPFDPAQSIEGGAKFLGGLLKQFKGNASLALAAYNAGPGAVQKYGGIPPYEETQRYVPKVLGYATQFSRIWTS